MTALVLLLSLVAPHAEEPAAAPPAPPAAKALPDLSEGLVKGQCANGPGAEGADGYFLGRFEVKDGRVTGTERWLLFSNPKWAAKGGKDCQIQWNLSGNKVAAPSTCSACDYGIEFFADPDWSASNCPDQLMKGRLAPTGETVGGEATPFNQRYGVDVSGDKVTIYFAKSGKRLAEGYTNGAETVWLSNHKCSWF